MATSKSAEGRRTCAGSASIFSGRTDPVWPVPATVANQLKTIWESLEPSAESPPKAPALGYRGCRLKCARKDWFAYGGVVSSGGLHRRDPRRRFEKMLLDSAPRGLLPPIALE